ncbi:MAG: universal stress protein, partial [Chitinophagaceae bacterium]|nr:universal stress protein [Chitinophagaceae bacterium]
DSRLIAAAIGQSQKETAFTLIHIVESPTAILGAETDDFETNQDTDRLEKIASSLREKGLTVQVKLGYRRTAKEIARIVKETDSDLLVVGAHGHGGFKDFIYGETVNAVRHELKVNILVVTL